MIVKIKSMVVVFALITLFFIPGTVSLAKSKTTVNWDQTDSSFFMVIVESNPVIKDSSQSTVDQSANMSSTDKLTTVYPDELNQTNKKRDELLTILGMLSLIILGVVYAVQKKKQRFKQNE